MAQKLIFEKSVPGRHNDYIKKPGIPLINPQTLIPQEMLRKELPLPSLGELDVVRHYTNLSKLNYSVDSHFYPLGSCTMKYNPKINEDIAAWPEFLHLHPYQHPSDLQGSLELMYRLEKLLCEITGMGRFTFQPNAGAHGELTGMLIIRAYQSHKKNTRYKVIVPDSAHGTNPATAHMCGYEIQVVESTSQGLLDIDKLKKLVDSDTAAIMLTNPNTLGLFEERILDIRDIVHDAGGLLYYDGANFNALLGISTPALMGFDVVHLNLHKTFSTPHGSGGPGAGVVGVKDYLVDFLPVPIIDKEKDYYYFNYHLRHSIGKVRTFFGNFGVLVRAYAYILQLGKEGLKEVAHNAVINANYIRQSLKSVYDIASPKSCMHEVVLSCSKQKKAGVSALDIAKRLIDYGIHPPTMYFPLIVKESLMVEPPETEGKETLDYFIQTMKVINEEIQREPQLLKDAPITTPVKRLDEVSAARFPVVRWQEHGD